MIVDPDFLDHWKTRMLADLLGSEMAPLYVLRLWSHCQSRRTDRLTDCTPAQLKAICRYNGDAQRFSDAMHACRWVEHDGSDVVARGWWDANASMVANWRNGRLGGRPKGSRKKPTENPNETHGLPMDNPRQTHGEPRGEDRRGKDRIGEQDTPPADAGTPKGADGRPQKPRSFKQWTTEDLTKAVAEANSDGLLSLSEAQDFVLYWTEPTASGRPRFQLEKAWDTRRRMQTARRMVYDRQQAAPPSRYSRTTPPGLTVPLQPHEIGSL